MTEGGTARAGTAHVPIPGSPVRGKSGWSRREASMLVPVIVVAVFGWVAREVWKRKRREQQCEDWKKAHPRKDA